MKVFLNIEINSMYLKLVWLAMQTRQKKIIDVVVKPIASCKDQEIIEFILETLKKNHYNIIFVTLILPRNFVTLRTIELPSLNKNELGKMVDLHVGRIIPYKKEDVIFSYQVCGIGEMGYSKVVVAIVQKEIVEREVKILEQAGILVDKIVLSSYSIMQWIVQNSICKIENKSINIVLDIDTSFTDLIIFKGENLLFSRSIPIKIDEINTDVGRRKLLGEIRQSLLILNNDNIIKKPKNIFLSGCSVAGLNSAMGEELSIAVNSVSAPISVKKFQKTAVVGSVSFTGLSALVIDDYKYQMLFTLPELQIKKVLREKIRALILLSIFSVYFISMVCLVFFGRRYNQRVYLNNLVLHSAQIDEDLGQVGVQIDKIEFVKTHLYARRIPLFILSQLQKLITNDLVINYIGLESDIRVVLRGHARKLSDVLKLVSNLKQMQSVRKVQTKYMRKKKLKNEELTYFELIFSLNYTQT
ncbi:MAG: hypothetical protein DRP78_00685 [Candidatus Omnitrophota bacterium]|nr:MAG: hypothetical protein DRP78_00685 [Candidatus Omnitrophota bacterium]